MEGLHRQALECPYCGEPVTGEAETGVGPHQFVEDCPVCCRPIEYRLDALQDGDWQLSAFRDDDA